MSDRNSTESRMVIRRNRGSPISTRYNSISSTTERKPSYAGIRKKLSVPTRPYEASSLDYDLEDIERRRRRIRSINNIVPPLPVSSKYRGYLPSRSTETSSTTTSSSHPGTRRTSEQNNSFYRISIDIDDDNVNSDNGININFSNRTSCFHRIDFLYLFSSLDVLSSSARIFSL